MYTHKQIWGVSYPIMLGLLAQNIINITDTAFLGHVGEVELGGSALGGLWYLAIFMLGYGFCSGAQILIGRRNGEGRQRDIAPYFTQGILFLVALAALIVVLTELWATDLLHAVIKSDRVFDATVTFVDWRIYGLFFAFPTVMFRAFFVGITHTRTLTVSALVMAVVNIGLDYLLIFGKLGFPALGLKGAAIASVIAEGAAIEA
jgi:putative MATE family efflux protein